MFSSIVGFILTTDKEEHTNKMKVEAGNERETG